MKKEKKEIRKGEEKESKERRKEVNEEEAEDVHRRMFIKGLRRKDKGERKGIENAMSQLDCSCNARNLPLSG